MIALLIKGALFVTLLSFCDCLFPVTFLNDPDKGLNTVQFIQSRGFRSQTHHVITDDGYILGIFRIINSKVPTHKLKRPIILWHGLMQWSNDFINNSPGGHINEHIDDRNVGNNLGFELAKRGYDVWLGNTRGNAYSRNHTHLAVDSWKFWNFSLDEMILYDVPAVVKHVRKMSGRNKIGWIGHSQGNTIILALMSINPEYSQIVEPVIFLAPSYTLSAASPPAAIPWSIPGEMLCANLVVPQIMKEVGGKFLPDDILRPIAAKICSIYYPGSELCKQVILFTAGGYLSGGLNASRMSVYLGYSSFGESTKNLAHSCQRIKSGRFEKFDYLPSENLARYGKKSPPEYDVSRITSRHLILMSSFTDRIADAVDVQKLRNRLRVPFIDYVVPVKYFSHQDFMWGMRAGELINTPIVHYLYRYQN